MLSLSDWWVLVINIAGILFVTGNSALLWNKEVQVSSDGTKMKIRDIHNRFVLAIHAMERHAARFPGYRFTSDEIETLHVARKAVRRMKIFRIANTVALASFVLQIASTLSK